MAQEERVDLGWAEGRREGEGCVRGWTMAIMGEAAVSDTVVAVVAVRAIINYPGVEGE